ncbi:MAG: DNA-directed RNA polymerase subunit omega [Candidatus Omnitrophica bacterium]|nr:DNA-directed RNA polymerase subunit omega [Candidatus Omnitrophota bacterium]
MVEDKDMSYIPIEDLLGKGESIYKLVLLAARRAIEVSDTGQRLVDISPKVKASTVALEEIKEGKVSYKIIGSGK